MRDDKKTCFHAWILCTFKHIYTASTTKFCYFWFPVDGHFLGVQIKQQNRKEMALHRFQLVDPRDDPEESFFITGDFRTDRGWIGSGTISLGKLVLQYVEESSIENTSKNSGITHKRIFDSTSLHIRCHNHGLSIYWVGFNTASTGNL